MKKLILLQVVLGLCVSTLLPTTLYADEFDRWIVRARAIHISPDDSSGEIFYVY